MIIEPSFLFQFSGHDDGQNLTEALKILPWWAPKSKLPLAQKLDVALTGDRIYDVLGSSGRQPALGGGNLLENADNFVPAIQHLSSATPERTFQVAGEDFLLRLYWRDVENLPVLTPSQEAELGWLASFGDEHAQERLVLGHLRFVVQMAWHYRLPDLPVADLINEGNLGLMCAARRFIPSRGMSFKNYAAFWIRRRMHRALYHQRGALHWPSNLGLKRDRLQAAEQKLFIQLGRLPDHRELSRACRMTSATVRQARSFDANTLVSLDAPAATSEEHSWQELIPDLETPPPDEALARVDDRIYVAGLLASLIPREQQVLRLRFGLDDGQERTLEEVGQAMGYVRQGIHKIEAQALVRLRKKIGAESKTS